MPKKTVTHVPDGVDVVSYATFASLLGVKVETIRSLAARGRLPEPAYRVGNSPVFAAADVNAFIDERISGQSRQGRPSRLENLARSSAKSAAFADRVRAAVSDGKHGITTLRALADGLGLTATTLNNRLEGRTRWTDTELAKLAELIGHQGEPGSVLVTKPPAKASGKKKVSGKKTPARKTAAQKAPSGR